MIKAPAGSKLLAYALAICESKDPELLVWGETGPRLMAEAVKHFKLDTYRKSYQAFCPVHYEQWQRVLEPGLSLPREDQIYAIHLWNEMWRVAGQNKNAEYPPACLYQKLKKTYLPANSASRATSHS